MKQPPMKSFIKLKTDNDTTHKAISRIYEDSLPSWDRKNIITKNADQNNEESCCKRHKKEHSFTRPSSDSNNNNTLQQVRQKHILQCNLTILKPFCDYYFLSSISTEITRQQ